MNKKPKVFGIIPKTKINGCVTLAVDCRKTHISLVFSEIWVFLQSETMTSLVMSLVMSFYFFTSI